jgi:hypothetical protein
MIGVIRSTVMWCYGARFSAAMRSIALSAD